MLNSQPHSSLDNFLDTSDSGLLKTLSENTDKTLKGMVIDIADFKDNISSVLGLSEKSTKEAKGLVEIFVGRTREYIQNTLEDSKQVIQKRNKLNFPKIKNLNKKEMSYQFLQYLHGLFNPIETISHKKIEEITMSDKFQAAFVYFAYERLIKYFTNTLNNTVVHNQEQFLELRKLAEESKRGILVLSNHQIFLGNPIWTACLVRYCKFKNWVVSTVEKRNFTDNHWLRPLIHFGYTVDLLRAHKTRKETEEEKQFRKHINKKAFKILDYFLSEGRTAVHFIEGGRGKVRFGIDKTKGDVSKLIKDNNPHIVFVGHEGLIDMFPSQAAPNISKTFPDNPDRPLDKHLRTRQVCDILVTDPIDPEKDGILDLSDKEINEFCTQMLKDTYQEVLKINQSREYDMDEETLFQKANIKAIDFINTKIIPKFQKKRIKGEKDTANSDKEK